MDAVHRFIPPGPSDLDLCKLSAANILGTLNTRFFPVLLKATGMNVIVGVLRVNIATRRNLKPMLVCPFLRKDYMSDTRAHMNHFSL